MNKLIKIDIVNNVWPINTEIDKSIKFERSLYGIAFDTSNHIAFLPEEIIACTLINSKGKYLRKNTRKYL